MVVTGKMNKQVINSACYKATSKYYPNNTVPIMSTVYRVTLNGQSHEIYEGISKSPKTMLITRKSLVVHKFTARVCCGGVL